MKITVCELPNDFSTFEGTWNRLAEHVSKYESEMVLLPEMPFSPWLAQTRDVNAGEWKKSEISHNKWIERLDDLAPAIVISTRPNTTGELRYNTGYIWEPDRGVQDVHAKYYLPDEPGFWEATWYQRGDGNFSPAEISRGKFGFLICTEIWFNSHAREYGKQGVHFLVCPRATPKSTAGKWIFGGQTAAVVSGAFCLSSNLSGRTPSGGDFAGMGWIIEPEEGKILGLTSPKVPFLTLDVNLEEAVRAKKSYPRYVQD
jgi:predicted amidohydrolase